MRLSEMAACITCSGAALYIYKIMGLSVLHAHAKERLPEDEQHGVAKTSDFLDFTSCGTGYS